MTDDRILVRRDGTVAHVVLNRPDKLNCVSAGMWRQLGAIFADLDADPALRCVVLAGAGEKAFCVGADLTAPPAAMWKAVPHVSHALTKPVIAATQGWVIGGGICLVMTCDLMVSADTTKFMYPEAKVGVFGGLMPGIVSRMPHKVAMELLLLGEEISVKRAYDVGFVNKVVPLGEERAEARRMATIIAQSAPLVIRTLRDFANQTLPRGPAEIFVPERYKLETIANSADRKEGAAAFREKRPAKFKGR